MKLVIFVPSVSGLLRSRCRLEALDDESVPINFDLKRCWQVLSDLLCGLVDIQSFLNQEVPHHLSPFPPLPSDARTAGHIWVGGFLVFPLDCFSASASSPSFTPGSSLCRRHRRVPPPTPSGSSLPFSFSPYGSKRLLVRLVLSSLSLSCSPAAVFPPKHSSATSEPGRFVQKLEKCQKANLSFFDKVRFRNIFF